jgi:CBS domain-containing protein
MNTIYEHMSSPVLSVKSDSNAIDGIAKMYKNNISALLVENDGRYVGIFTKADWIDMIRKEICDPNTIKISEIMVNPIIKIEKGETLAKAISLIENNHIRHLVVTDNDMIIGMLSVKDLEKYFCQLHDQEGIAKY